LLLLKFSRIENIPCVVNHHLEVRFRLELSNLINSLSQVFPSQHDVLDILQWNGQQGNGIDSSCTVSDLVHCQAVDLVHYTSSLRNVFNLDVLLLQLEEQFNLTVDQDVHFVVVLGLLEDLIASLEHLTLDMEDYLFICLNA
jgi:hypothetical protein